MMICIKNADIYTPYRKIQCACLLIEHGKIQGIVPQNRFRPRAGMKCIDARGKIVCPGFIDVHLQGAGGCDILDATTESIETIARTIARFGTTSFLATTVFKKGKNRHIENIVRFTKRANSREGANLLGIHLEGPFISPKKKGMIRPDGILRCSPGALERVFKVTGGTLRMMTIAPELKGALDIIKRLRKKRIVASFGHSDATLEETQKGIDAGITHVTHVFNAMRPIHHRDPGPLASLLMDDRVSVQLIGDGVHIDPAVLRLVARLKGVGNIVLITDSMSSAGLPDGTYVYDGWEYISRDGACRYDNGTLIGTSLPLHKMLKRLVQWGGIHLPEAIQTVTINPARVLGIAHKKGSIEPGRDADVTILSRDYNVFMSIIGGHITQI